jgi:hypothetical protein
VQIPESNPQGALWLVPLVALLAAVLSMGDGGKGATPAAGERPAGAPGSNARSAPANAPPGTDSRDAIALVRDFFGEGDDLCGPDEKEGSRAEPTISFLIATLPDPVDSRLDYLFDRHFDALQRALETQTYIMDRFHMPWPPPGSRARGDQPLPHPIGEPGVVLFRDRQKLLVLFIVGETATSGIDKLAFHRALDQMARMKRVELRCLPVTTDPVLVMGPTFSGSATSLQHAIQDWRAGKDGGSSTFRIVSGSATAIPPDHPLRTRNDVCFDSMVREDGDVLAFFLDFLGERGVEPNSVAMLVEANTGYGAAVQSDTGKHGVTSIPFPLHVADLRRRREQEILRTPQRNDAGGLLKPGNTLPVQTWDPARESLPSFSDLETASVEPLLESTLASLARNRIRYVGIAATDVRDIIFLALEVRRHAPNVAIFTLTADNLYLHSSVHSQLQGMLILGTYPLFPPNRLWTWPFTSGITRLQFPTANAQGVYNATLRLLRAGGELEIGAPYTQQEPGRHLPAWLTAVGGDGLWPIAYIGGKPWVDGPRPTEANRPTMELGRGLSEGGPAVFLVVWCLASLLAAFELRHFFQPVPVAGACGKSKGMPGLWREWLVQGPSPGKDLEQQLHVLAAFSALLDVHLLILWIWCLPYVTWLSDLPGIDFRLWAEETSWSNFGAELAKVGPVAFALIVAAVLWIAFALAFARVMRLRRQWSEGTSFLRKLWLGSLLGMCLITVLLALCQGVAWLRLDPVESMLLFARATSFGSGFSPLGPSILAGLAILSLVWCSLRRANLLEMGAGLGNRPVGSGLEFVQTVHSQEARVLDQFRKTLFELPRFWPVLTLFAVILVALFSSRWASTVETQPFGAYFKTVWAMAYLVIALEFVRFVEGWNALHKLLRLLRGHPSFTAYRELQEMPDFPKSTLTRPTTMMGALHVCVDRACDLVRALHRAGAGGAFEASLRCQREPLQNHLRRLQAGEQSALEALHSGERVEFLSRIDGSIRSLDEMTGRVAALYEPYWNVEEGVTAAPDAKVARADQQLLRLGHQLLASRFVLFIQHAIRHLQGQVMFVMIALLLMLLAVTSYPFQPRGWLLLFNWALIMTVVLMVFVIFLQMNRNEILSELTGTTPGAVSLDRQFLGRVMVYGFIPVLGLLRAQYPGAFEQLISWFRRLLGGGE